MKRDYKTERNGTQIINHQGLRMTVKEYINVHNVKVEFDDGTIVKAQWRDFNRGYTSNPNYLRGDSPKIEREGEERINHQGCLMKIIKYISARKIIVQFDNDPTHIVTTTYRYFNTGVTHNPYIPTVYGVGILGNEKLCITNSEGKKIYDTWRQMIGRCYNPKYLEKYPTYRECKVSDEFLYYPNFYNWVKKQENYEKWKDNKNFNIDKDIIQKGNKVYSPETCCLVPNRINNLIKVSKRSKRLLGVRHKESEKKYYAVCKNLDNKIVSLGSFETEYEAFLAYKKFKENIIKLAAEKEYENGMITKKCRDALMNYKIEETD